MITHTIKQQRTAMLLLFLCGVLWSLGGIFIKLVDWNPLVIAGLRSVIAGGVVAVYLLIKKMPFIISRKTMLIGLCLCGTAMSFVAANKLTTAANAIVLQFTAPIHIIILSAIFLGKRFRRADIAAVVLTMGGISLFFLDSLSTDGLVGNLLGLLAGLFVAGMYVMSGECSPDDRMSGILMGHIFTAIVGICAIPFYPPTITTTSVVVIVALGIVQLGIPYVIYGIAMKHCPPLRAFLISAAEPLLNPVWVFLFDGEAPGLFAVIGGVIVILTVTIWSILDSKTVAMNTAGGE